MRHVLHCGQANGLQTAEQGFWDFLELHRGQANGLVTAEQGFWDSRSCIKGKQTAQWLQSKQAMLMPVVALFRITHETFLFIQAWRQWHAEMLHFQSPHEEDHDQLHVVHI